MRLAANADYWDKDRGPRLEEVVFRNDLSPERALELVKTTDGEVDILTRLPAEEAVGVESSGHAKLVSIDAISAVAGVINRDADGLPLADARARRALNLAIDRDRLVREAMSGHADPLAGLALPSAVQEEHRLPPHPHDPQLAAELWQEARREAGSAQNRPLRIAVMGALGRVARAAAGDVEAALGMRTEVVVYEAAEEPGLRRRLAEKRLPQEWDVLIHEHGAQAAGSVVTELHRAFVGAGGEFRAGPVVPAFEELYVELSRQLDPAGQAEVSHRIDRFVRDEALALSLCAPHALYAVNRHVDFTPYRTTFELAECSVNEEHWSRP